MDNINIKIVLVSNTNIFHCIKCNLVSVLNALKIHILYDFKIYRSCRYFELLNKHNIHYIMHILYGILFLVPT